MYNPIIMRLYIKRMFEKILILFRVYWYCNQSCGTLVHQCHLTLPLWIRDKRFTTSVPWWHLFIPSQFDAQYFHTNIPTYNDICLSESRASDVVFEDSVLHLWTPYAIRGVKSLSTFIFNYSDSTRILQVFQITYNSTVYGLIKLKTKKTPKSYYFAFVR